MSGHLQVHPCSLLNEHARSEDEGPSLPIKGALDVYDKKLCVAHSDVHGVDPQLLQRQARNLHSNLHRCKLASQTQVILVDMWAIHGAP